MRDSGKAKSLLPLVVYLEHLILENGLADTPGLVEDVFDRVLLRLKSRYKSTTMNKKGGNNMSETQKTVENNKEVSLPQLCQNVRNTLPEIPEEVKARYEAIAEFINNEPSQLLMHSIVYILATTKHEKIRLEALRLLRDRLLDIGELY